MQASPFEETAFYAAIARSAARALLIGRRAMAALGTPMGTYDYDFCKHHFNYHCSNNYFYFTRSRCSSI